MKRPNQRIAEVVRACRHSRCPNCNVLLEYGKAWSPEETAKVILDILIDEFGLKQSSPHK